MLRVSSKAKIAVKKWSIILNTCVRVWGSGTAHSILVTRVTCASKRRTDIRVTSFGGRKHRA